jgi:hypothetical protein
MGMNRVRRAWWVLLLPLVPVALLVRALLNRRRATLGGWPGAGPPPAGVREPRRPRPSPSAASMAIEEDGEPVQL